MAGLNFCHDGEAKRFSGAVTAITARNKKRKGELSNHVKCEQHKLFKYYYEVFSTGWVLTGFGDYKINF